MKLKLLLKTILFIICISNNSGSAQLNLTNRYPEWNTLGLTNQAIFQTFNPIDFNAIKVQYGFNNCETFDYILSNFQNIQINLPPGDLYLNCKITLPSNVVLAGDSISSSTLIFENLVESDLIQVIGTNSTEYLFENVLSKNQNYFIHSSLPQSLTLNEMLYIYSPDDSLITSSWASHSTGQYIRVTEINSDTVFFENKLRRDYALNSTIQKIIPIENCGLKNLSIINQSQSTGQTNNILFQYARNCFVSCISSLNCNFAHINISNASGIEVKNSSFKDGFDYGDGGKAYGVVLQFGTGDCLITSNYFNHLRHSMLFQAGSNGNVVSYNYSIDPYWTAVSLPSNSAGDIVLHGNYPYMNLIEGNSCQHIVIDDSHGKNGPFNTFLRNRANLYGIFMNTNPSTDSINFIANEITNSALFMGNFVTSGNGHISSGNNKLGVSVPINTENNNPFSLYIDQPINFYTTISSWPPIGYPNSLSQYLNKATYSILNNESLCNCCIEESASLLSNSENEVKLSYSNDFSKLHIHSKSPINYYSIYDLTGKLIITMKNINSSDFEITNTSYQKGYYLIQLGTATTVESFKILLN